MEDDGSVAEEAGGTLVGGEVEIEVSAMVVSSVVRT